MAKNHPEIVATITDDFDLKIHMPSRLKALLCYIGAGKQVRIDVKRWYKKRTNLQNATSWGPDYNKIIGFILEETGQLFTSDQLHEFHKETFLGFDECKLAKGLKSPKSTTQLTTVEYNESFRELYCKYWAERGLYIPDPIKKDEV